jgi:putative intracellular protease/amidase
MNAQRSIDDDYIYDIIIIPGGEGVKNMLGDDRILNRIKRRLRQTKYTAGASV